MLVYVLALSAALLFGIGTVVQQHAAAEAPPQDVMSIKLLFWLVRRPVWLAGVVIAGAGNGFSAAALGMGGVALVEPLLAVRLLFALPLAAAWRRCRVPRRDWLMALALVVGLAIFIAAGAPSEGDASRASGQTWAVALAIVTVLSLASAVIGRGARAARRATLLAAGAGLLFATQDTLISTAVHGIGDPLELLQTFYPYVTVVAAVVATLFLQSAFELAPLPASFPAQVTAEPLCGIALGVLVLDGFIRLGPVFVVLEIVGLALMVGGIFGLARSPLVTGHHHEVKEVEKAA